MTNPAEINRVIAERVMGFVVKDRVLSWELAKSNQSPTTPAYYAKTSGFICDVIDWNPSGRIDHADMARRALPEDKRHKFVLVMDKIIAKETVGHAYFDLRWNAYNATPEQISRAIYEMIRDE